MMPEFCMSVQVVKLIVLASKMVNGLSIEPLTGNLGRSHVSKLFRNGQIPSAAPVMRRLYSGFIYFLNLYSALPNKGSGSFTIREQENL